MAPMENSPPLADRETSLFQPLGGMAATPADLPSTGPSAIDDATGAAAMPRDLGTAAAHAHAARRAEAEQLLRRGMACWNARDFAGYLAQHSEQAEVVDVPAGRTLQGAEANLAHAQAWATAFPDGQVEITRLLTDGDTAMLEFIGRGMQTGPLVGETGTIPPTGRRVELHFCYSYDIADGKIRRVREYYDMATMLRQLGMGSA